MRVDAPSRENRKDLCESRMCSREVACARHLAWSTSGDEAGEY